MSQTSQTAGLVLTGGGARAAYQVGVLKAISDQLPDLHYPFPIICGASAGGINAVGLASSGDIFRHSVERLDSLWSELRTEQVYRSDFWGMAKRMGHFVKSFLSGDDKEIPASMLDNAPLRDFLVTHTDFTRLREAIASPEGIRAVCLTACGYRSGQSVSFFEASPDVQGWHLGQRVGVRCELEVDHLLASAAIPTIFPPVRINREYFGDGVVRNMAPLSPAVHLGCDRILVIGVSANRVCAPVRRTSGKYPSLAQIMEHMLNGAFIDTMENDIDRALIINQLLKLVPEESLREAGISMRPLEMLVISPSQPIDEIAARHAGELPKAVRQFLGQGKPNQEGGASLASYLLFEGPFMRDLIKLGYQDAQAHARQIENFFSQ
ncbi:predicted esterase of the alpha-beta hydrolase superfamily [Hahella chejuensis KCTC 2396]|uniref:Predicted esterase of the alpha-beta hydrolase superfamily n=1 Tax=Hahella chejuensis (strain KCTC 2396) TaxID=349521 RepID=Q2S9B9_HAHCH|nr:patatin-like phospholipase family protein [Hahella chejuensis]ABC32755.1 predicted esterase of the alpha-beta hydrolase superfamily [Hahella chejuensis KCTC 2396]